MQGSKLLKVISILMIIGGIIGAVGSVIMALFAAGVTAMSSNSDLQKAVSDVGTTTGAVSAFLWIGVVVMVISSVIEIIAGVKGKKNWDNPAMAKTLMVWGIVAAVVSVLGNILYASTASVSVISIVTGLVLPILYIIGTVQLKKES